MDGALILWTCSACNLLITSAYCLFRAVAS